MPKADGKSLLQRIRERYIPDRSTGCWNWTAGINGKGYAYIWIGPGKRTVQAYKVFWVLLNGPVPKGKELHHMCMNRACVNPDHLEVCTRREHQSKHPEIIYNMQAAQKAARRDWTWSPGKPKQLKRKG